MADLDSVLFVEYGYSNKLPLALVEVAQDIGQEKPTGVIRELAKMSNLPAFVALYTPASRANPVSPAWHDIDGFRVSEFGRSLRSTGVRCRQGSGRMPWCRSVTGSCGGLRRCLLQTTKSIESVGL